MRLIQHQGLLSLKSNQGKSTARAVRYLPLANKASTTVFDFKRGELFFFARGRPEFFFTERASPRAFLFFCGGGELKFFSGKTIPKSTKFFRPAAPERGRRPSFDLKWRRRLALGGLKLF